MLTYFYLPTLIYYFSTYSATTMQHKSSSTQPLLPHLPLSTHPNCDPQLILCPLSSLRAPFCHWYTITHLGFDPYLWNNASLCLKFTCPMLCESCDWHAARGSIYHNSARWMNGLRDCWIAGSFRRNTKRYCLLYSAVLRFSCVPLGWQ